MILVSIHMSVQNGPTNLVFNLKLSINYPWLPCFLFPWGGTRPLFDISSRMFSLSTKVWNKRSNGTLIAAGRDFEFWGKLGYLSWNFKFESIVIHLHHYIPCFEMVKLYSDTRIRIASFILHLISNSRIFPLFRIFGTRFSHANLGTPRRFGPFGCKPEEGRADITAAVWLRDLLFLLPKKARIISRCYQCCFNPFFFRCPSHIYVKWCLIISYVVSQP